MKKEYLLVLGFLVLGYAFYSRYRIDQNPNTDVQISQTKGIELLPAKSAPPLAPASTAVTPAEHGQMMALGIRQRPLPAKNSDSIKVIFKKKVQWCALGDLDFIKVQSVTPDQAEWRLSLEQDDVIASVNISLQDMIEGRSIKLKLPVEDGVYALYLCKNSDRGSCTKQKPWNPSQLTTKKLAGVIMNAQILIRQEGRVMLMPTDNWSQASVDRLQEVLRTQGLKDHARLDVLYETIGQIKPYGAQFDERGLILPLALNDPRCLR